MDCDRFHSIQCQSRGNYENFSPSVHGFFCCLFLSDILWIVCGQLSYTLFLTLLFFKNANIWEKQTCSINQTDSHLSTGQCATIEYLCLCFLPHSLVLFLCPLVALQLHHRVTLTRTSCINMALTPLTSPARRDTCLSALLGSRSREGQELTFNETQQQRSGQVNGGCGVMSAAPGWAFI